MAYNANQENIIAFEIARAGGHINAAVEALRRGYESFETIGASTLRRLMMDARFQDLVAEKLTVVRETQERAIRETAERRALQEMEGSLAEKLRANESLLVKARKAVETVLANPEKVKPADLINAFRAFEGSVQRERERSIVAVSENASFSRLLIIFGDEARNDFGPERGSKYLARVRERFIKEEQALNAREAATPDPNGEK